MLMDSTKIIENLFRIYLLKKYVVRIRLVKGTSTHVSKAHCPYLLFFNDFSNKKYTLVLSCLSFKYQENLVNTMHGTGIQQTFSTKVTISVISATLITPFNTFGMN